jgi:hypothetical protein
MRSTMVLEQFRPSYRFPRRTPEGTYLAFAVPASTTYQQLATESHE